ncbi:hypothetical protein VP01_265g13 [Puccinia sorghi]|uniref:Uncharacterized protein n=1 Tax=Puccinia sorghi TaxID=27349 RepID=A0A0L6V411_9BASI|nr:hypothetical protein VP01_265g13 [Puccinia sorghi]
MSERRALKLISIKKKPIYEAHMTTSKTSASSTVPPAPLSAHPSYSLLGEMGGAGEGDEGASKVSYARKDSEKGRHVVQLVSHAALDTIDALIWADKSMYLKQIDRFHEWSVSAWIPPGGMRFVLLHEIKNNDDGIKMFFLEAWESFVRVE